MALPEVNDSLWSDVPEMSSARAIAFRSRSFWSDLYLVGESESAGVRAEIEDIDYFGPAGSVGQVVDLVFSSTPLIVMRLEVGVGGSTLSIKDQAELGWLDPAHPVPHVFRWSEVEAIASHLETERGFPTSPRLALLLLAPFVLFAGQDDAETALVEIRKNLAALRLFSEAAVESAMEIFRVRESEWVADPSVGWTPTGNDNVSMVGVYSRRDPDHESFPAEKFLALLRHVGVADVPPG